MEFIFITDDTVLDQSTSLVDSILKKLMKAKEREMAEARDVHSNRTDSVLELQSEIAELEQIISCAKHAHDIIKDILTKPDNVDPTRPVSATTTATTAPAPPPVPPFDPDDFPDLD
jgi:hypothetical protein